MHFNLCGGKIVKNGLQFLHMKTEVPLCIGLGVGWGLRINYYPPPLFSDLQYTYIIHAILFYVIKWFWNRPHSFE